VYNPSRSGTRKSLAQNKMSRTKSKQAARDVKRRNYGVLDANATSLSNENGNWVFLIPNLRHNLQPAGTADSRSDIPRAAMLKSRGSPFWGWLWGGRSGLLQRKSRYLRPSYCHRSRGGDGWHGVVTARAAACLGLIPKPACVCGQLPVDIAAAALLFRRAAGGNFPMRKRLPSFETGRML